MRPATRALMPMITTAIPPLFLVNNKSDEMYDKLGSCPSQILRNPSDNIFDKFSKKDISQDKRQQILNSRSYRPPILSLEIEYFKGFNLNSLDSIFEGFKSKVLQHNSEANKKSLPANNKQRASMNSQFQNYAPQAQNMSYGWNQPCPQQLPQYKMGYPQHPMQTEMCSSAPGMQFYGNANMMNSQMMGNQMVNASYPMQPYMMYNPSLGFGYQSQEPQNKQHAADFTMYKQFATENDKSANFAVSNDTNQFGIFYHPAQYSDNSFSSPTYLNNNQWNMNQMPTTNFQTMNPSTGFDTSQNVNQANPYPMFSNLSYNYNSNYNYQNTYNAYDNIGDPHPDLFRSCHPTTKVK